MNTELQPKAQTPEKDTELEHFSEETAKMMFPILDYQEIFYNENEDQLPLYVNTIVHYLRGFRNFPGEELHRFKLKKTIDGLVYIFSLGQTFAGYGLSFKTHEYDDATTSLSQDAQKELAETLVNFVKSIAAQADVSIEEITVSPSTSSYSSKEVEECMQEILISPKNTLTKEDLVKNYRGHEVFDLYEKLFDKTFHKKHYNLRSRAKARSRYFKRLIKTFQKDMHGWELLDYGKNIPEFTLKKQADLDNSREKT